jgi:hypothetical protein
VYDTTDLILAQYAAAALGVLTVTGEYATRSGRSTVLAAPRRLHAYAAKAVVITGVAFGAGMAYTGVVLAVIRPLLGQHAAQQSGLALIRSAIGTDGYLALITLLGLGIDAATRYTAGALLLAAALLLLAPQVIVHQYLPVAGVNLAHATHVAAGSLMSRTRRAHPLDICQPRHWSHQNQSARALRPTATARGSSSGATTTPVCVARCIERVVRG